jgi:hypothetical protein
MITIEQHGPAGADRFSVGRNGTAIDRIVIHTMVGWISQADRTFKTGSRQVSAHYGVRVDGTIWQWVKEEDTAWHAGNWPMNLRSIGIEHEDGGDYNGLRPDALYAASSELVADIARRYNIPVDRQHILAHREVADSPTACPDNLDIERIVRGASNFTVLGSTKGLLERYAESSLPTLDMSIPRLYQSLGALSGILPEVAFAQALHETGNFTFPGTARPEWHNPAGIGVTGAPGVGNVFPDWEAGIRAHLGHLLWYFGPNHPIVGFCDKDPRHFGAHKLLPNDLRQLNGKWAVPGTNYGESIYSIVNSIRKGSI